MAQRPTLRTVMGMLPQALGRFVEMANAARVDLGPCDYAFLERLPKPQVADLAERVKGTLLYVAESPVATLGRYHRARRLRDVLLKVAQAGEFIKQRIERKERGAALGISRLRSTPEFEERQFLRLLTVGLPVIRISQLAEFSSDGHINVRAEQTGDSQFFREFNESLSGVEATRIRSCRPCGRIFWAKRRDKLFCSPKCQQRHWQVENPEKAAEIQNRYDRKRGRVAGVREGKRIAAPAVQKTSPTSTCRRVPRLPGTKRKEHHTQ